MGVRSSGYWGMGEQQAITQYLNMRYGDTRKLQQQEAEQQKQISDANNRLQQNVLDEQLKNQQFEQRLADERAKTAEIAASNQNLEGGTGAPPSEEGPKNYSKFGRRWGDDPTKKFRKFDGSNFLNPNKEAEEAARKGWGEGKLALEISSRDAIENKFAPKENENQNNTGPDMATTQAINSRMFGDAKERAKKWTVGYGTRFG